jgi:outer membrane receptor protein involved in Fe transport
LDSKGQQLSASTYFSQGPDDDISDLIQDTTNNYWVHDNTKNILKQHTAQNSFESELRTKLDYTLPIGEKGKLDAGYQGRYSNSKADYHFSNIDPQGTAHEVLSQRDSLDFTDNIQAGYASFSNSMSIIDYQLGLRAEYEHRDINQQISKVDNKIDRVDYFPSVYLTRQLPWDLQLQASYTRRINRPRDWSLDPLPRYMSPIAIRVGNPKLFPEFANSFELNLQKKINDASFISIEGFLRQTNNLMQQVNLFDPKTMITTMTTINIDHDQSIGAEFMLNLAPLKWFNLNSSASLYNYQLFGQIDSAGSKNTTTWNVRINPSFRLVWGTSIQLNYTYNAPTITSQGTRSGFYNSSIGIRQDLLKHKGSLTLNIQNPFGITRMSSTTVSDNLYSSGYFQRESKVFMLTFSYRINNYKVQQNKRPQDDSNGGEQDMNGGM